MPKITTPWVINDLPLIIFYFNLFFFYVWNEHETKGYTYVNYVKVLSWKNDIHIWQLEKFAALQKELKVINFIKEIFNNV